MRSSLTYAAPFILCLLIISLGTHAQTKETSLRKLYAYGGAGAATRQGYSASTGVQAVWKGDWTTTLSYHHVSMNPKNLPDDYEPGHIFLIPDGYPESIVGMYSLSVGKYFTTGRKSWLITEVGVSTVQGEKFTFHRKPVSNGLFYQDANYNTTTEAVSGLGVLLKADFTYAFSSFAGMGIGVYADLNSVQSPAGIELKLVVGWMNRKE